MNTRYDRRGYAPGLSACALLVVTAFSGCDSSDSPPPEVAAPPPSSPPPSGTPPLDPTVVSLDDHHRVGTPHWPAGNTSSGGQGSPVDGLECVYPSPVDYHVHAHLSIFLDGEALAVPGEVGMVSLSPTTECHYPIHTHDASGVVHTHATMQTFFTLGEFFDIWGEPLQRDNIAGLAGLPVVVYVTDDGVVREYTGELANLQLLSHREITIQVGTPVAAVPQFTWTGE